MIIWNQKIKKTEDIIKAVMNSLYKLKINVDGVADTFNNGVEQGSILKVYDRYNPNIDVCLWIYFPSDRPINNHIEVILGKHINCTNMNMWDGADLDVYTIEASNVHELHNNTRDFVFDMLTKKLNKTTADLPKL